MSFELQQLRQVIALAEHGSFVRAAAALHMSQPALSRSIQQLEERFGSELFTRTGRGAIPTDLGRLYVERARDLLRMADDLDREAVSHGRLRTGRVAVGGGPYPAESVLARAATAFIGEFPAVSVRVCARDWDDLARMLRARELDFFVAETSTLTREPDLEITPLSSEHAIYFIARAGHPLEGRRELDVTTILAWPLLSPARIPPRLLDPLLAAHRIARASGSPASFPAIQFDAIAPLKRALASSDAVSASLLACCATELETGRLVVLGSAPWMHLQYGIVRLVGHPLTQVAERFLEFVRVAEQATMQEEARLAARFGLGQSTRPRRARGSRAGRRA